MQVRLLQVFGGAVAEFSPTKPVLPPTADPRRFGDPAPLLDSMRLAGLMDIQHAQHSTDIATTTDGFARFALWTGPLAAKIIDLPCEDRTAKVG